MSHNTIAIAGAGIGGLTAAIALTRKGFSVRVYERSDELRTEGAGITLQVNAMQALEALNGLRAAIAEAGEAIEEGAIYNRSGRALQRLDMSDAPERFGTQGVALHRGRLMKTLAAYCEADIEYGRAVTGFSQTDEVVTIEFADGTQTEARALIGCDGLYSAVRKGLLGDERYKYAGYTSWRGVVDSDAELYREAAGEYWGVGERFGIVPIGHGETYWFAVANARPGGADGPDPIEELKERFEDWPESIERILDQTDPDEVIRTDIFDRDRVEKWGEKRVTLLGDAAHPMTPNLGQGAGQAIEDAIVLADTLDEHQDDIVAGLREYEDARRDRANELVDRSRRLGQVAQWESPAACTLRDVLMWMIPSALTRRELDRMYGTQIRKKNSGPKSK
ncbi:MAG: FAD-dependent monooxygenase [Persicimonas sp.]